MNINAHAEPEHIGALEALMDDQGYINPEEGATEEVEETEGVTEDNVEDMEEQLEEESEEETEGDEPAEEPEEESQEEENPEDQLFDITIGEEEYEVNLEELKSGYLRNEDLLSRRTQLEEEYNQKQVELEQTQQQLLQEIEAAAIVSLGEFNKYQQINWAQLKESDPEKYTQLRIEAYEAQEKAQALIKRRQDISSMTQQAAQIRHQAKVEAQAKLAKELIPEMATDPDFRNKVVAYGRQIGYTEDEVLGIDDARQLAVLNHARLYAESQVRKKEALGKKITKELPPVIKPNAPKASNAEQTRVQKSLRQRMKTEQSVDAAAAFFLGNGMV